MKLRNKKLFKVFVQKQNYELYLLVLLNQTHMFSNNLRHITKQSNSECDFIDINTGKEYEATLLMNQTIISSIIKNPTYIESIAYLEQRVDDLATLFKDRIIVKQDKKASIILFNIIPDAFSKVQGSLTEPFFMDNVDIIIKELEDQSVIKSVFQEIILVSYNTDNSFYVRTIYPRKNDLCFINNFFKAIFPFEIVERRINFI